MVTKEEYSSWEKKVIGRFFLSGKLFEKKKWILFFFNEVEMDDLSRGDWTRLEEKKKVKLFHMGKGKEDSVSYGKDSEEGTFKFAGTDTGGLTNVKIKEEEGIRFLAFEEKIEKGTTDSLFSAWLTLSKKKAFFPEKETREGFDKWVESVLSLYPSAKFGFWSPPSEMRVILPAKEVKDKVGTYYVRSFGPDSPYARKIGDSSAEDKEIESLFCGISEKYVTPNLNRKNLENEYPFYHEKRYPSFIQWLKDKKLKFN
jgi:hypothetical protein